jgi:hypothetical protein
MRRAIPWVLLSLLGLVTVATAALGAAGSPTTPGATPSQWVAGVLATTARAGSAHLIYAHVTASPNPDLRGTTSGQGVVDFSRGSVRVTQVDHEVEFEAGPTGPARAVPSVTDEEGIILGSVMYARISPAALGTHVTEADFPFMKESVPRQPRAELGLSFAFDAPAGLGDLAGIEPVVDVRDLGSATLDGRATTEYLVETAPLQPCPPVRKTAIVTTEGANRVWVDGHGRLVQVRTSSHFSGHLPAAVRKLPSFARFPVGPITTTDTLTFSAFGAPVHIAAPPPSTLSPQEHSSTGYSSSVRIKNSSCPSS